MLTKRIIPCLDIRDGRVVKGVNFDGLRDIEDPVELAKFYNESGADELVFYDITASYEKRPLFADVLRRVAECIPHALKHRRNIYGDNGNSRQNYENKCLDLGVEGVLELKLQNQIVGVEVYGEYQHKYRDYYLLVGREGGAAVVFKAEAARACRREGCVHRIEKLHTGAEESDNHYNRQSEVNNVENNSGVLNSGNEL